ncbi:hypothetical protein [Streptomyces javensis]|uniref:Uncharacterized protein n=1 Tax=Streptomyces javensis TaxID=114698 RepID=A0ABS0R5S9_9ACTN|nr:hypothetical protein [Streptomyces javensis]MBI0312734.1 hypothetical protein [Streptomyces javensis]
MSLPLPGKQLDPIVFGPEYDPRNDPKSVQSYGTLQAADPRVTGTQSERRSTDTLILGRPGRGKTSAWRVMHQLYLAARRKDVAMSAEDPKTPVQRGRYDDLIH